MCVTKLMEALWQHVLYVDGPPPHHCPIPSSPQQCYGSGSGSIGSVCFGHPGSASGSVSHKYGSGSGFGSGSFHHQAKIVRITLISSVMWLLCDFLPVIRIYRLRMFSGIPDTHPDPVVRGTDPRIRIRTDPLNCPPQYYTLQCYGSVTFWCGSGSAELCLWLTDPDPDTGSGSCYFRHLPSRC